MSPYFGIVYNVAKCGFFWVGEGLVLDNYVQGITVTQTNFTNGWVGIYALPGGTGLDELALTGGNQFNTTGNQIVIQQPIGQMILNGNQFFVAPNNSGIYLDSSGAYAAQNTIVNNIFYGPGATVNSNGIYVAGSYPNTILTGNSFLSLNVAVNLPGTSGWNVQANTYQSVTTTVTPIGTNSVGVATQ